MDRQEYIDYLVDQGYSEEEIVKALQSKDFTKIQTDPPKKQTDPVKTETSTGSIDDMVSNLGDFSSESPTTSMYGFELSEEDIKSINRTDKEKAMDFALSTNPKYQELNSQLKEIQASKVLSPMAKDMQAKAIEKEINKVKYYLGHKEASVYRALQQEEQVSPSSLLLKNNKYQNTKKALENIKTATKGDVTAITFVPEDEKIELQEDVENELIEQISKDEKKLDRYANYESTLTLTGSIDSKENLITKAKSKALSNKINEVTEEFNSIDFSQMTKEEAQNKYKEYNSKVFQLQTEYDFNAAESIFYNNFEMTDEYEKYLNREMEKGGFTNVAKDASSTLLQELIKVPIKSTIGTGFLLGNAVTEILEDAGIKEKTDDVYTGGDIMLDMFKKYISDANPLGVTKSEDFTFDFGDGFKAKNAAKFTAQALPFVIGVIASKGVRSTSTAAQFGKFKLSTSRLAQMKAATRMTSIDSYFEGKEMGLSDGKAITYGFLKSIGTGLANGIMPDANLFGGSVGKNALVALGSNLKSATNKAQIKAAANAFVSRPLGEIAEEEVEAGLGDLAKLSVGIKGKGELLNVESQSQLVAGTLLLTEVLAPFGLSADLKNSKRAIYRAYRENGAGIIEQMKEEKREAQLRMDRARTPERKAKWKQLNEQYDKALEYASDLMLAINVSPESATPEELDLLREKQGLMRQKQGKDPLYTKRIDKQIKEIDDKLEQGEVSASRETIRTRTSENVKKIIDDLNASTESNVLIESFEKDDDISATDKIKNKVKEIESQAESIPSDTDIEQSDAFVVEMKDGSSRIFINSDVSKETKAITAPQHELLHVVLKNTFKKNPELANQMKNSLEGFLDELSPSIAGEGGYISAVLKNYKDQSVDIQSEEFLTALSDAMSKGFIESEIISETALDKIGNAIKSVLDKVVPNRRYKFNSGKDVFSFIKDFNKSVYKGEFSNKLKNTLEQGATTAVDAKKDTERKVMASVSEKPKAIFMVGGPGAGKTNVGKGLKLGRRGFKVVNQDIALEAMKEEAGLPAEESEYTAEQRSLRSKLGASAVKAAKEKFNQYVSNKNDMVIDGTGASYNATIKKVKELEDAGFDVSMVVANTPLQTALDRNKARKERSLPDKVVTKTYDQVQESLAKYKQDFGSKLYEINTEAIEYGKDLPQDFLDKVYKGVGVDKRRAMYSKSTVLEEINNLIPEGIETKEQFLSDRSFTKVYESAMNPGGAINNYIKSRTSSAMEAELAVDSVLERLMNFDPQAKRKDGSIIGREGFGEFIFANTAFGKLDAKKKLFQESERRSKETSIDESTKQIADVETSVEEQVETKEKPKINPLKFTGVPAGIKLSDKPGKGLTFKKVAKQYAGEVGEQAIGIPAKKITESAANLGSVNEARAIQQFFFKADNLDKFIKILPETNIALPETEIGIETIDVSKGVQGTGLGLPKRILDYFYEDFIDPTGKLTSPKGRSKGLTSQTAVKRLKPEFRGVVSKETIDKIKKDIGITPKGELNILPKGELRSPIGQLLKGMAKTYSTLAANTLVRQEMEAAGATKQEVADVAAGKQKAMLSISPKEAAAIAREDMLKTRVFEDLIVTTLNISRKEARELMNISANTKDSDEEKAIYDRNKKLPESIAAFEGETVIQGVSRILNNFLEQNPKFHEMLRISSTFGLDRAVFATQQGWANNIKIDKDKLIRQEQVSTDNYSYTKKKLLTKKYLEESKKSDFAELEFKRFEDMIDFYKAVDKYLKKPGNKNDFWAFQEIVRQAANSQKHFSRSSFPRLVYEVDIETGKPITDIKGVEEHFMPQNLVATLLLGGVKNGYLKQAIDIAKAVSMQGFISKELDDMVNVKYKKTPPDALLDRLEDIITGKLKLDQGLASIIRYTESDIDLNRLFYVTANKTLGEYFFDSTSVPVKVQKEMVRKLFSGDITLDQMREYGAKYAKTTVEKVKASKSNISKTPSGIISKASKSNDQVLNNLNNYDKALRNARNPKAPVKGISVFDFDDTLATTKSMVGVTMPDGTETKINATEFAKVGEDLLEQGATFDFSDFSKVVGGEPGPLIAKLDKAIKKFGNKDVFVLTARPANSASAIHEFLKGLGYEIPLENITGLANSSPEAKAQWMVDKAAEGYNDFYFTDDAYKNVKAVQDAMKVLDVKSKERIVYKDAYEKLDREFNDILEAKTGIASEKRYSDAKAEVIGVSKGKFNFFISPSAEDFVGLLYSTLSKSKLGENQMAWYKKNLLDPYTRAMNNIANERMALSADYKALKKQLGVVPKKLKQKIKGEGFSKEQAIRIYIWNKQGFDVPGLSKTDLADMTKYVENDATLQVFADQLVEITKGDGYAMPGESWMAGSITTDLLNTLQVTKRAKHLEEWQQNVDVIFSKENLNKMEAAYGSTYRGAMENMLQRMKSGKNRNFDGDSLTGKFLDWVNGSTGAIMFFNTRSAILQTISAVNFINWSDNNVFKASAAFANQKQYWKDFMFLFNSDFLKERRDNLTINVNEADIAEMANKGGAKGALAYLLQKGFLPTQIADGFAIASGGSTFYRNRIKTYLKEGMSQKEAETKAFEDFREAAEESQQSSRPDRISQQQAGPLGRVVLAFANTPSQYARIIKKASLDLANNRGDFKTNLSKIMYYSVIQGVIFTSLQSALFAADFDDEEEMEDRIWRMSNSVVDGIMRGAGVQGAVTSVVKNATLKAIEESKKKSPKYNKVVNEIVRISPPVSSKISKLQQAAREVQWNREEMETKGFSLDNPAWLAAGNVISATTNVPADRVIKKINNVDYALSQELELYERLALLGGWQKWELGLDKEKNKKLKNGKTNLEDVQLEDIEYEDIEYEDIELED